MSTVVIFIYHSFGSPSYGNQRRKQTKGNPKWKRRIETVTVCKYDTIYSFQFSSVQSLSHVQLFATPWTAAWQASLSITNPQSLFYLMSIESVMPFNHLIFCRSLLLPPSIFTSIRIVSNESVLHIRWPKFWSSSFSISPSNK